MPTFGLGELSEPLSFILELGVAVAAALIGGAIAVRLRQPVVIGYLVAGIVIGPSTAGLISDVDRIAVLAEVGIVLLLFALGVEFSIGELRRLRRVALPGAIAQIGVILVIGGLLMAGFGFEVRPAFIVGACVSISSTIVVLKALVERGELDSLHGRVAIGWMIVQDIATIVFIVALPPLAGGDAVAPIVLALIKAAVFLVLAYVVGVRLLPWLFTSVSRLRSNELFMMAVVATALLTAFVSSAIFGLSLALGAFVAGLVVSESDLSHQAAAEVTPFRDLFAVFFFVSVGTLVDPVALVADLGLVAILAVLAVVGKGVVTTVLGRALGLPARSAILLGAAVAQVGEFSFILVEDALHLELIDERIYNIVLGTAVVSILAGSLAWRLADALVPRLEHRLDRMVAARAEVGVGPARPPGGPTSRTEEDLQRDTEEVRPAVVVLGGGRVGRVVVKAVRRRGFRCVVVDRDPRRLDEAAALGAVTLYGDAASPEILKRCGLDHARVLVVAVGDPLTAALATERALRLNPRLSIASRARGLREIETLRRLGVGRVADPEAEAAFELARHALQRMGVSSPELSGLVSGLRRDVYGRDRP
ncbi:YbaL family putative K(+) efflux transporter [soil metagenome]